MSPTSADPRVSIVIPVHGKVEFTLLCLQSIEESQAFNSTTFEVVVVDNASDDATPGLLESLSGDVRSIRNEENLGFGDACNQGAAIARGDYVLFLNNDTAVVGDWLDVLVSAMDEDPRRGAAQPKLLYPDGRLNDAGGLVFRDGEAAVYGKGSPHPEAPAFSVRRAPDYASGACLVVRRAAFDEVGGFDHRYSPAYYEDADLSFSLRAAGWTLLYEPAAVVIHVEGGTAGTDETSGFKAFQPRNRLKFASKWNAELRTRPPMDLRALDRWAHRPQGGWGPGETAGASPTGARVLVLDPVPPMYDRAGGCRRTLEIEKALRSLGHSVLHEATTAAPERDRYARYLSRWGIRLHGQDPQVPAVPLGTGSVMRPSHEPDGYDVVIAGPWYTAEANLPVLRASFPRASVVVDTCDLHFLREERAGTHPPAEVAERRARELATYAAADAVLVVSQREADILAELVPSARTFVVGTAHDVLSEPTSFEGRRGVCFVGNTLHAPNREAARWLVDEVWPRVSAQVPDALLQLVGNDPDDFYGSLAAPGVQVIGRVESTERHLDTVRVSVAPILSGAGIKIKIAEAVSRGVPVVTTEIGAEGLGLVAGESVLVGETAEQLAQHVVALLVDDDLWRRTSMQALAHARSHFGPARLRREVAAVVDAVTPARTPPMTDEPLTLVINTKDEAANLEACLASCEGVDRVVVVDMQSQDETREIARRSGAEVHSVPDVGYVEPARQYALSTVTTGWVLVLDADERMPPGGIERLRALLPHVPATVDALLLTRFVFLGGRAILSSGWDPRLEQQMRVLRAGSVTWPDQIHAVPLVGGDVASIDPQTGVYLDHHNWSSFQHFLEKTVRYTAIEAGRAGRPTTSIGDDVSEAVEEFARRYSPDSDGEASFALSFGMLCYKLFTSLQVGDQRGSARPAPDADRVVAALRAFADACYPERGGRARSMGLDGDGHPATTDLQLEAAPS